MNEYTMKEYDNGMKEWFLNGKRHREDGPAIDDSNGHKAWFLNGKPHREDGPAIEYADGYKSWYLNGELHREDGPAIERDNGMKEWYLNGVEITEEQFIARTQGKELTVSEIEKLLGCKVKIVK